MFVAKNVTDMRDKVELPTDEKGNPVPFVAGFQLLVPKGEKDAGETDNNTDN
jgi:hypothetical protein